ncbi:MAG TPA: MarC family protein [Methanomicrobiales archaeon]|nr:MarC family protein [Methanomicrobiales archaeon]
MDPVLGEILYSTLSLVIILDPILSVPIFVSMTKGKTGREVSHEAGIATGVAGGLMFVFLFGNILIFEILGISISSFQVAGGILLFLLGLQEAMGITLGTARPRMSPASVVIGTPLLCGPGTITQVILLTNEYGYLVAAASAALAIAVTWLVLKYAALIQRLLGETVTDIIGKVLGMILAAIAVQLIIAGIKVLI